MRVGLCIISGALRRVHIVFSGAVRHVESWGQNSQRLYR